MKGEINVKEIFPERLKEARIRRDMTQAQTGEKAGIYPSTIAHFEAGSRLPSLENLFRIGEALMVPTDYLIGRSEEYVRWDDDILNNLSFLSAREYELIKHMIEYMRGKR